MYLAMRAGFSAAFGFVSVLGLIFALLAILCGHQLVWRTGKLRSAMWKRGSQATGPAQSPDLTATL